MVVIVTAYLRESLKNSVGGASQNTGVLSLLLWTEDLLIQGYYVHVT